MYDKIHYNKKKKIVLVKGTKTFLGLETESS